MSSNEREPLIGAEREQQRFGQVVPVTESASHQIIPTLPLSILRPRWKTKMSFVLVLLTETLERTAFYGIICNLVLFLNTKPLDWASYNAANAMFVLNGISYVMAIFGGWIADACFGKFHTILLFFVVYIVGFAFWPFFYPHPVKNDFDSAPWWCAVDNTSGNPNYSSTNRYADILISDKSPLVMSKTAEYSDYGLPWQRETCSWAVYLSITIIAIGYGSIRANIIPFGAHQFEHEGSTAVRVYFNWLYWSINIGALIAFGVLGYVQQDLSYFWGFLVPLIALVVALFTFAAGSCIYIKKSVTGSVITNVLSVCKESLLLCCHNRRRRDTEVLNTDLRLMPERAPGCLDYARVRYGGGFGDNAVDDVKQLGRILVVFVMMIPYWTVYYQMQTTFVMQGLHMQLDFDNNDTMAAADSKERFVIPAAWLSVFNVVFVLIFLPVLDRLLYPLLDRCGLSPSLRTRIIIGMVFAVFSVTLAGAVEHVRLSIYWQNGTNHTHFQRIGVTYFQAAKISVLWQIPQYALIGVSELFASIGGLELAYIYAPRSMQGIIMGLYMFSQGLGSLLGTATLTLFKGVWITEWDHGDISCEKSPFIYSQTSECRLDFYFYFLAGLQVFGIILFYVFTYAVDIGSRVLIRTRQDGQTVMRPADDSGSSTRSTSPYITPTRRGNIRVAGRDMGES